jgi:heat shock protein HtpX
MASRRAAFGRDTGLQARMLLTLFLLGLVYAVLIGVLVAAGAGALTIAVIAGGLFLIQFFTSDKIALASMGAHVVSPEQAPKLHAMIERLCIQANLPKPKVAIAETAMPNAFAIGRSPRRATVCATTGILDLLSPGELEGVLAHELTHVQNRDVMVMTIASFFASIAAFIVQMGFWSAARAATTRTTGRAGSWSSPSPRWST